jgi:hypothetical protein
VFLRAESVSIALRLEAKLKAALCPPEAIQAFKSQLELEQD